MLLVSDGWMDGWNWDGRKEGTKEEWKGEDGWVGVAGSGQGRVCCSSLLSLWLLYGLELLFPYSFSLLFGAGLFSGLLSLPLLLLHLLARLVPVILSLHLLPPHTIFLFLLPFLLFCSILPSCILVFHTITPPAFPSRYPALETDAARLFPTYRLSPLLLCRSPTLHPWISLSFPCAPLCSLDR